MTNLLLNYVEDATPTIVHGSTGTVKQGYAMTRKNYIGHHPEEWVSRDTTFLLGCNPEGPDQKPERCAAEWVLPVNPSLVSRSHSASLIICCDRAQGGLHTPNKNDSARIFVNNQSADKVKFKEFLSAHGDYFHRVVYQDIPKISLIESCGTVYLFNFPVAFLTKSGTERVSISLDPRTGWDIDYVVLLLKHTQRRMRPWVVALIFTILGAIFGATAAKL